ncbi:hypothetical protein [Sedimentitalea todarodis]|uniref:Glycosyltransferase family 1 protein n=1 Tax=Sedimentitalea todarodis TaxID=1631240 RepID=A0ABU3VKM5_9RHOB|nr:hypothetical protein [Sedimentitalea todarodis]MDU9006535.1 hypothetical protein [Sedimentitalea todarodis]
MIRVFTTGRHAHRSPLRYPALADLFQGEITQVTRPDEADLYVFAHSVDIAEAPHAMVADWRARRRPVVLLSEEPFWDTIWTRRPMERHISLETGFGALPVVQLAHATSAIFRFREIPYYLLTNNRFANAYRWRFARNASRGARYWRRHFAAREEDLTFMFERRPGALHDVKWPAGDIVGLCAWRTTLAERCEGDKVQRLGQSWQGGVSRFDLANWHFDKLMRLDGATGTLAAIENTHQPDYLTEKLFDAFACGARPLYHASPGHRLHQLGLPEGSWLNLHGLTPEQAAGRARQPFAGDAFIEAFHGAQLRLAALFGDAGALVRERRRLRSEVLGAFATLLEVHGDTAPGVCP